MEKFQERNLDGGQLFLFGEINEENAQRVIEQLVYLDGRRRARPHEITVWVNSPGGLLQPALAIADVFDRCRATIRTIGMGTVESAASYVVMAGSRGHRFVSRYASIMIHEFTWSNSGSYTEMQGRKREVENTQKRQLAFVAERTGATPAQVRRILRHEETWLTPEEAIELGVVDGIYE